MSHEDSELKVEEEAPPNSSPSSPSSGPLPPPSGSSLPNNDVGSRISTPSGKSHVLSMYLKNETLLMPAKALCEENGAIFCRILRLVEFGFGLFLLCLHRFPSFFRG